MNNIKPEILGKAKDLILKHDALEEKSIDKELFSWKLNIQ